ncbi:hypothetical protein FGIG_03336 [Fasciola gigantica]|uniref:Uncharacterized protein n=1 Tax=Fasciola gigantica TaxID=46835 RepID=A0A504YHI0_FASGI|nr:hypothetical protein FGIG_03336 [Fasciola gigantica]
MNLSPERNEATVNSYDDVIKSSSKLEHLESTVHQLVTANIEQEELSCELKERLKKAVQEITEFKETVDQCRQFLERCQSKNPKLFDLVRQMNLNDSRPLDVLSQLREFTESLLGCIELQEVKLKNLEDQRMSDLLEHRKQVEEFKKDCSDRLQQQRDQFDEEMTSAITRAGAATSEARTLSLQAASMRSGLEEKLRCKTEEVDKLKEEVRLLTEASQNNSHSVCQESLQSALDKAEQDVIKVRCERDAKTVQNTVLSAKLEAAEAHMREVDTQWAQVSALNDLIKQQYSALKTEFDKVQSEKAKLSRAVFKLLVKLVNSFDCDEYLSTTVKKVTDLTNLSALIKTILKSPYFDKRASGNCGSCPQSYKEMMVSISLMKDEMDRKEQVIRSCKQSIVQQNADLERVAAERDYYLQIVTEQGEELCTVKADFQRQLKELEKLKRAQTRLDELTFQMQLLKTNPVKCAASSKSRKAKPIQGPNERQVLLTDSLGRNSDITGAPSGNVCAKADRGNSLKSNSSLNSTRNAADEVNHAPRAATIENTTITDTIGKQWLYFSTKLNGLTNANTLLEIAKKDIEMACKSVNSPEESNHNIESLEEVPLSQLESRLNHLEEQMLTAASEKHNMQEKSKRMNELLQKLTEQNRKLMKELKIQASLSASPKETTLRTCDQYSTTKMPYKICGHPAISPQTSTPKCPSDSHVLQSTHCDLRSPVASPIAFESLQSQDPVADSAYCTSNNTLLMTKNTTATLQSNLQCCDYPNQCTQWEPKTQLDEFRTPYGDDANNQVTYQKASVHYLSNRGSVVKEHPSEKVIIPQNCDTLSSYRHHLHFDYRDDKLKDHAGLKYVNDCDAVYLNSPNLKNGSLFGEQKLLLNDHTAQSARWSKDSSQSRLLATGAKAQSRPPYRSRGDLIETNVTAQKYQSKLSGNN